MDPIAECFVQLINGVKTSKKEVNLSYSKIKIAILETLKKQGLIENYEEVKNEQQKYPIIKVILKYKNQEGVFNNIRRVSRPGRRVYLPSSKIHSAERGKIDLILSTSQGVMSGREAHAKGLGGEVIGEVI